MSPTEHRPNVRQIGTVEVLRQRIYPLDPKSAHDSQATTVVVEPGTFAVYREFDSYYWLLTGRINARGFHKIGDGMFEMNMGDHPRGPEVTFPSKTFGANEFRELLAGPGCVDGPEQRLRFDLAEVI